VAAIFLMAAVFASGEEYLSREDFLNLAFTDAEYSMEKLWLTENLVNAAKEKVGHAPRGLRQRYWRHASTTAWILEDIGKEKPITLGVVIEGSDIERVEVLAFRESRGYEIRYPFFTRQFPGVQLADDGYLSKDIDGITGATLSVRAVERMSRMALWLNQQVQQ
jgi:FMN-binding domain